MTSLKEVAIGSTAKVELITGSDPTSERLLEMGITPGVLVTVIGARPRLPARIGSPGLPAFDPTQRRRPCCSLPVCWPALDVGWCHVDPSPLAPLTFSGSAPP